MKQFLICNPLKNGKFRDYKRFVEELNKKEKSGKYPNYELTGILKTSIWRKVINGDDYIIIYHEVMDDFLSKINLMIKSENPEFKWFIEKLLELYKTETIEELLLEPEKIV